MVKGQNLVDHLMKLDELVLNMGAIGDPITEDEALVILLGSLTEEYQNISRIIENMGNVDLICAKEILQREWRNLQRYESSEVALKATKVKFKQRANPKKNDGMFFNGRCFHCNKRGH